MDKIQTVGKYFVEVWKAVGMEGLNEKVVSFFINLLGSNLTALVSGYTLLIAISLYF